MIKHIVMWNFAEEAEGADKAANLAKAQAWLASLSDIVPGIGAFEAVLGTDDLEHSYDLLLYSEFENVAALKAYATHPKHLALVDFIIKVRSSRVAFDYEA